MYCYLEFKLSYLKNLKLFSIRVKELSEPIVLWRKGDGFLALFISIFLRIQSLSDARRFYGQTCKIEKGNLYLTENRLNWNEMCCASDNHNYMCHTCAILKFELQLSSSWQNIQFSRYCPKFHIFTKIVIFQVFLQLFRLFHPYKFYGRGMSAILFFIFASCEPLRWISSLYLCKRNIKTHRKHIFSRWVNKP